MASRRVLIRLLASRASSASAAACRGPASNSLPPRSFPGPGADAAGKRFRWCSVAAEESTFRPGYYRNIITMRALANGSGSDPPPPVAVGDVRGCEPRRFAVLTTGHGAPYCEEKYGGYGPLFIKMLSEPGEEWDEYFVVEGQFPNPNELHKYDGFVVTGSRHDAHGDEEWIHRLCGILQQLHHMKKKSLCVCFGHQVLSRALGGKTGRASVGWEVGLRDICLTDAFFSKRYAAGMPPRLKVLEVHRDQVSEVPPGAEVLASSERTGIEMYAIGDHFLAIQGHPEFFDDVVLDLLDGRLAPLMTEEEVKLAKETLRKALADQQKWQQLCKDFLKGSTK